MRSTQILCYRKMRGFEPHFSHACVFFFAHVRLFKSFVGYSELEREAPL